MAARDAFDGVFDDPVRGVRIKYRDGRVIAVVNRIACNSSPLASVLGMEGAFGSNPPPPSWLPLPGAARPGATP